MINYRQLILVSAASLTAFGLGAMMNNQVSAANQKNEKCFGIVKAGQNDCQTANSSCAGTAKTDGQGDAWVYTPKGLCERIVNGSLEPRS